MSLTKPDDKHRWIERKAIRHQRTGDVYRYEAVVTKCDDRLGYTLRHSHRPKMVEGAGPWASDSFSYALTLAVTQGLIANWGQILERCHTICEWSDTSMFG